MQLGRVNSLREIAGALRSCEGSAHRAIEPPVRSSLAYANAHANAHRPWQLFEPVFHGMYVKMAGSAAVSRGRFSFKNKLVSIDSTVIEASLSMDDSAKHQNTKGAVKFGKH